MANLIGSLRLISSFDWSEFFESVSLVEHVLQRDPAGMYGRMDFRSRDRYRHAVEELAEPTGEGQIRVALKSVERARRVAEPTPDARETHVGYYLIGTGRRQFERSVDWTPASVAARQAVFFRYATPGYLGTIGLGTALLVAAARPLRVRAWLARRGAGRGRAAGDDPGKRAGDPDRSAHHQPADPAAAVTAPRTRPRARRLPHDGDRAHDPRQRRAGRRS